MLTKGDARLAAVRSVYLASREVQSYVEIFTTPEERAEFLVLVGPMLDALARRFELETRPPMETRA
jgi:hypothetical protein